MGNRVSKSNEIFFTFCGYLPLLYSFVKEQRVYGSYCLAMVVIIAEQLRCILTVYESRYQVEVLYNLDVVLASLSPFFVTGFIDAEGSFMIKTRGLYMQPEFCIGLHVKDKELLLNIKQFYDVGTYRESGKYCYFSVRDISSIVNVIIPHLDKNPLQTQKKADYLLFKQAVLMMYNKTHLDAKGKALLVNIKANLN